MLNFDRYPLPIYQTSLPLPSDHGVSGWTSTDPLNPDTAELLYPLDVVAGSLWKLAVGLDTSSFGLPTWHGLVHWLDLGKLVDSGWERWQSLAVDLVGGTDLQLLEVVEDIKLGQVEGSVVVDGGRVLEKDQVEPTTSPFPASGDANFSANGLELLSDLVDLLGWEWTATDSGLVGLDHTNDLLQLEWRDTKTGEDTTNTSVGGGNHWIGTPVNVQQQGVSALNQHWGVALLSALDERDLVHDVLRQPWSPLVVPLDLSFDIVLQDVAVALLVRSGHCPELVVHELFIEDLSYSHTRPAVLGLVAWADTLLGGANGLSSKLDLLQSIDKGVKLKERMRAVADEDTVLGVETVLLKLLEFVEELRDADDASAANQVRRPWVDEARWQNVEVVGGAVNDNGVAGIVPSSRARNDLELVRQDVYQLALACSMRVNIRAQNPCIAEDAGVVLPSSPNCAPSTTVAMLADGSPERNWCSEV